MASRTSRSHFCARRYALVVLTPLWRVSSGLHGSSAQIHGVVGDRINDAFEERNRESFVRTGVTAVNRALSAPARGIRVSNTTGAQAIEKKNPSQLSIDRHRKKTCVRLSTSASRFCRCRCKCRISRVSSFTRACKQVSVGLRDAERSRGKCTSESRTLTQKRRNTQPHLLDTQTKAPTNLAG
jgi:hypothetical protein